MPELVVIPTVPARGSICKQTVKRWQDLGYKPLIFLQNSNISCSSQQHGKSSLVAIRHTYEASGRAVIFCEDDVLIDPAIVNVAVPLDIFVLSFYLPGKRFYPHRLLENRPVGPMIFEIIGLKQWFGSQCLWLSPPIIEGLFAEEIHADDGLDERLKRYLLRHDLPLHSVIPNLVQHLCFPSVTSKRYKPHKSTTFREERHA